MLRLAILYKLLDKKGLPVSAVEWDERDILAVMKDNMPTNTHVALEKAWDKTITLFKKESVKIR